MVGSKINDDFDALGMGSIDQVLKISHRTESRIGLLEVTCPVSVIGRVVDTGVVDQRVYVLDRLGYPECRNAQISKIVVIDLID